MNTTSLARLSLVLNVMLLGAVIYLFVLVSRMAPAPPTVAAATKTNKIQEIDMEADTSVGLLPLAAGSGLPKGIYFVNTDTLLNHYTSFKKSKEVLEAKSRRFETDMQGRMSSLQNEYMQAQQKVQAGTLTQTQAQELEQQLVQKQQQLAQYKDQQAERLMTEEKNLSTKLNNDIQKFMKGYGRRAGFTYVLGYTSGGGILYAHDSLDITQEVIKGLNGK